MSLKRLVLIGLFAAGCPVSVEHPLVDCVPEGDGGRACYHAPEAGETWVPDCELDLEREYWRVFVDGEEVAYLIPRPDAAGLTYGICDGEDADLAALFDRNGLCAEVADPAVVNTMTVDDALAVARALHERLDFEAVAVDAESAELQPYAPVVDLADACAGPAADVAELDDACEVFGSVISGDSCLDIGYILDEAEATAMAAALDELYGI